MATVIDQLIVTLGLDPAPFRKGTNEATRQTKRTEEDFKKAGEKMTRSITDVARNIFVAFVGFESASGLITFLGRLNQAQASLGRMAANFGTSARALDVWDKKIELAGGTVRGAQDAVNQLNQDVIALQTRGEVSPLLVFLNQLGVATMDASGHVRDAKATYEDLFATLAKLPRSTAFQLATQAGVSPDILAYGLRPENERRAETAEAERLSRATEENTRRADELRARWVEIRLSIEAIGISFLEKITPTLERLLPIVEKIANRFADFINGFKTDDPKNFFADVDKQVDSILNKIESIRDEIRKILSGDFSDVGKAIGKGFNSPGQAWKQFKEHDPIFGAQPTSGLSMLKKFFTGLMPYQDAFNAATLKYKLPAGMLRAIAQEESGMNPNAVSPKGAVGLMQLLPQYHPNAGKDPLADIDEAARTLAELSKHFNGDQDAMLAAYNAGSGRIAKAIAGTATVPAETVRYVANVQGDMRALSADRARAGTSSGSNTLQIDSVVINTKATDGKQVAIDFMDEMKKRKDFVWQTESGLIP